MCVNGVLACSDADSRLITDDENEIDGLSSFTRIPSTYKALYVPFNQALSITEL